LSAISLRLMIIIWMIILTACIDANIELTGAQPSQKIVPAIGINRGINLGNWLEAPNPGEWGVNIEPWHFFLIRRAGFDTVRIPVRFSVHADQDMPYTLDPIFMEVVDDAIQQSLQNELNVILTFQHYEEIMKAPAYHTKRFLAIWQQLAERYQGASESLYFELLNEPHDQLDASQWNALLKEAIKTIRISNPNRWIIAGGGEYNHVNSLKDLHLPDDEFLIATFHFYEPFNFTHQGASWVPGSDQWDEIQWTGTEKEKQFIVGMLDEAYNWSQEQGVPLLIGEFGTIASVDNISRSSWAFFISDQAQQRGIPWVYWDLCGEFRVLDCKTGVWNQKLLEALIESY